MFLLHYLASTENVLFTKKKKDKKEATFPFFFKENCNIYE